MNYKCFEMILVYNRNLKTEVRIPEFAIQASNTGMRPPAGERTRERERGSESERARERNG